LADHTLPLFLGLLVLLAAGLVVVVLVRRPANGGGVEALAALSGKLDALGAAQDRQASAAGERLASQERLLADRFAEARTATDAALAAQRERLFSQEQALADRLAESTRMLTEAMTTALSAQNTRLAQQERALADRLAATQEALAGAVAAQNERLGRVLSESAVKAEETAGKIHERLAVIDAARANMEALGAQVGSLAQILGNKQARGAFGEVQLRQLIEDRLPADGFVWQHTLSNKTRCDCLIRLPHPPGPIAVDSKFPLEAWLAARDAADDAARLSATKRFAADIGRHIDDVAGKYICPGETAEGALIFVPSEAIYADLHAVHPGVVEAAARRGIYIVSPSTMWAVLGTMRALMQDVRMRAEAGLIKQQVAALVQDVFRMDDRVAKLKKHFADMQNDVLQIEISSGKIARRGVQIEAVELSDMPALPAPPSHEAPVVPLRAG
jgi:DNA recombination protein RmuC